MRKSIGLLALLVCLGCGNANKPSTAPSPAPDTFAADVDLMTAEPNIAAAKLKSLEGATVRPSAGAIREWMDARMQENPAAARATAQAVAQEVRAFYERSAANKEALQDPSKRAAFERTQKEMEAAGRKNQKADWNTK
ncbi:MAG: hypothetical protein KIS92_00975 [Planctomycetota bacterium]|nr:hypothetical protein [Planctomycetota bacterium]